MLVISIKCSPIGSRSGEKEKVSLNFRLFDIFFFLRPSAINDAKVPVIPLLVRFDTCRRTHTFSFMSHTPTTFLQFSRTCSVHSHPTHINRSHMPNRLWLISAPSFPASLCSAPLPTPWRLQPAGRAALVWSLLLGRC